MFKKYTDLTQRTMASVWHPCSQMKDYETLTTRVITRAKGVYLYQENGEKILDAISSWWTKSLGHGNQRLKQAIVSQLEDFEHVILANTTNEVIVSLSERLSALMGEQSKVFYASDGSCAVEIALKMSIHYRKIVGESEKTRFIALENAYHGETIGALSVSDLGLYKAPYKDLTFNVDFIRGIPYVDSLDAPLSLDCSSVWPFIEKQLETLAQAATALIIEPLVQGAGGMKLYSLDFMKRLARWAKANSIHLIVDEIMTGFGRMGRMLATDYLDIEADFICVAKGLTAGVLPMSATIIQDEIYQAFYDDYEKNKAFLHSHTHTGNALAARVALEVFSILEKDAICEKVQSLQSSMRYALNEVAIESGLLTNIRGLGAFVAADLPDIHPRLGFEVYKRGLKNGLLLRPLGNTLYWLPPLTISNDELELLKRGTIVSLKETISEL